MKVYLQVIDTRTGVYQTGMLDEPTKEGFELRNALEHFGVNYLDVMWEDKHFGKVEKTTKVVVVFENNP